MQVEVVLPLAIDRAYTYNVPSELEELIEFGIRVEVQFGKRRQYSGVVVRVLGDEADPEKKSILGIIDEQPLIGPVQFQFWKWMSGYYMAYLGEVMNAALPSGLKLSSETKILKTSRLDDYDLLQLSDDAYLLAEALSLRGEITLAEVYDILSKKSVYRFIQELLDNGLAEVQEELKNNYRPKRVTHYELAAEDDDAFIAEALKSTAASEFQTNILLAFVHLRNQKKSYITKNDLSKVTEVKDHALQALVKKKILRKKQHTINRFEREHTDNILELPALSGFQKKAYDKLQGEFSKHDVCLLHGVTGSGKTRLYLELIKEQVKQGGQILFLLPEIALTSQIIKRISDYIDYPFLVYHSRITENNRVDIYKKVAEEPCFVVGARSALLLPFNDLRLVIVDEEHDSSYKQNDPSPRYHGRDAAIMLSKLHKAKVILGSATPSVESYYNAQENKYGYVPMLQRYADAALPEMSIANLANAKKQQPEQLVHFTPHLLDAIKATLVERRQVILFQNRRGYAPYISCPSCGWSAKCIRCDVSLTHHKRLSELRCHYCGYRTKPPSSCPECGFWHLENKGAGTERIESELEVIFPDRVIKRFDADSLGSKKKLEETIFQFDQGEIDILVGTQMLTKGLDFRHVGLVGILNMDSLLSFPDFRATERAFQTIMQVAGRAGRSGERGQAIIQLHNPKHPLLRYLSHEEAPYFYQNELGERKSFHYPPFVRLIGLSLKHKNREKLDSASQRLYKLLRQRIGNQVFEPVVPYVSYVNLQHIRDILIKTPNHPHYRNLAKKAIKEAIITLRETKGMSSIRVNIDVDPA